MSRYIDADAIKIPSTSVDMFENCRNCNLLDEFQVREIIDSAPSIDIVRCRECKYFKQGVRFNKPRNTDIENFCTYHMVFGWNANAFCSYGERIDDGNTV